MRFKYSMSVIIKEPGRADAKDKEGFSDDPSDEAGVLHLLSYVFFCVFTGSYQLLIHCFMHQE